MTRFLRLFGVAVFGALCAIAGMMPVLRANEKAQMVAHITARTLATQLGTCRQMVMVPARGAQLIACHFPLPPDSDVSDLLHGAVLPGAGNFRTQVWDAGLLPGRQGAYVFVLVENLGDSPRPTTVSASAVLYHGWMLQTKTPAVAAAGVE